MLDSAYHLDKIEILHMRDHLLHNKAFSLQADFADYLFQAESESAGFQLFTFDKRLAKTPGVTLAG